MQIAYKAFAPRHIPTQAQAKALFEDVEFAEVWVKTQGKRRNNSQSDLIRLEVALGFLNIREAKKPELSKATMWPGRKYLVSIWYTARIANDARDTITDTAKTRLTVRRALKCSGGTRSSAIK